MLAAEALEHEDHDVARPERGRIGLRIVIGRVERVERFGIEETGIAQRAVSERAQQAERVAQNQVRLAVRRGVERRVAQRDRAGLAAESAPDASERQRDSGGQYAQIDQKIPPAFPSRRSEANPPVTPDQTEDQRDGQQHDVPVLGHGFQHDRARVVVVAQVRQLVGGETLSGIVEIDAVREVDRKRDTVDRRVEPQQHALVALPFAESERQQRQQDERRVDVQDRRGVEREASPQQVRQLVQADRSDYGGVHQIENHAAHGPCRIEQQHAPDESPQQAVSRGRARFANSVHGRVTFL